MAEIKVPKKGFDTCFENRPFADLMQKMAGQQGVGSLSAEMMKKIPEKQGDCCGLYWAEIVQGIRGESSIIHEEPHEKFNRNLDRGQNFLRQLTLIYHYIHFRLDRPYLARRDWPDILENLKEELEESLTNGGVPEGWLECLFLCGRSERQKARFQEFESCRGPFFSASRQTIETALRRLKEIEIGARHYGGRKQKEVYVAAELDGIRRWAWQNAWRLHECSKRMLTYSLPWERPQFKLAA